jgi:hypothetical protein
VDASGNAYVTGFTRLTFGDFPTVNPLQPTPGGGDYDSFVAKVNAAGSALVYSTYLGGRGTDWALGIAVDGSGNAYVTGLTGSVDFPVASALQGTFGGNLDGFVAKVNSDGSALVYSTYLGGRGRDSASGIAVGASGEAYVTGSTGSPDFPTGQSLAGDLQRFQWRGFHLEARCGGRTTRLLDISRRKWQRLLRWRQ